MPEIVLMNRKGRDATVMAQSVRVTNRVQWQDHEDHQANSVRLVKGTVDRDYESLLASHGSPAKVAEAIIQGDPEVNLELTGTFMRDTARVYVNSERQLVYSVSQMEIVRNPDGSERTRRNKKRATPNVGPDQPLRWSGKLFPKAEAFNKFVMVAKQQIVHVNGLTYDFLFEIARDLEQQNSLLQLGGGPKGKDRLVLRRGSVAYTGFLEGRTRGEEYCLLLHLSNIELKAPEAIAEEKPS